MNLQRLKFAYARGARIQFLTDVPPKRWLDASHSPQWEWYPGLRIHPEDAHLEYGPLSAALREHAKGWMGPRWGRESVGFTAEDFAMRHLDTNELEWFDLSRTHKAMAALLMAEALCDEGL